VKLDPEALADGLSAEQQGSLRSFEELLRGPGAARGVVAKSDLDRLRPRHILDSLRAVACLGDEERVAVDVGSGGGLPGVPLAIARPDVKVVLLEPRESRVAFLELVLSTLRLENASVRQGRAEGAPVQGDVCLARALAKPLASWQLCSPLLSPGGRVLYFAGASFGTSEVAALTDAGVRANNCDASLFPGYGPIVIMQSDS
jgi:16S rRNA (guanine527-N7)-methyltransferase